MLNLVGQIVSIVVGAVGLTSLVVAYLHNREANDIDRFEAIVRALEGRVDDLERELGNVKQALGAEQGEHAHTRKVRDISLRYNREVLTWQERGHGDPMPEPTPELLEEL